MDFELTSEQEQLRARARELAIGDTWVHLRYCVTCKETRCCDDSKNRHARKHAATAGHPVIVDWR